MHVRQTKPIDLWHYGEGSTPLDDLHLRQGVREAWPRLGRALDAALPSDILAITEPPEQGAVEPEATPVVSVKTERYDHFTVAVSLLIGLVIGAAIGTTITLTNTAHMIIR